MRAAVVAVTLLLLSAAPAAAAGPATPVTPAGAQSVFYEAATPGYVYFSADDTLYRQSRGGAAEAIARGGHFAAEGAGGVVVYTREPLVAADQGTHTDDLYLIRPGGPPILVSGGAADSQSCGQTFDGQPAACFVSFGSLTPDGQGIVFTADYPPVAQATCTNLGSGGCTAYMWRDGAARQINAEMGSSQTTFAFNPDRAFATDDGSTVILGGLNLKSPIVQDRMTYYQGADGSQRYQHRGLITASADRRSALLQGYDSDPSISRWDAGAAPVTIGPDSNARTIYLGASPDLGLVYYATDDGGSTLGIRVDDHGTDRALTGAPVAGVAGDTPSPPPADAFSDEPLDHALSPDAERIVFGTRDSLVAGDAPGTFDVYEADAAGGPPRLVSTGSGPGVQALTGVTGGAISFTTSDALTCEDTDTAIDTYIRRSDGELVLATPGGSSEDTPGRLLPDGDVLFRSGADLLRTTPVAGGCAGAGGAGGGAGAALALKARVVRGGARACGRVACGRRAVLSIRVSRKAKLTVRVRKGARSWRLVSRTLPAGRSRVTLPYLPRRLAAHRRYPLTVRATAAGQAVTKTLKLRTTR